MSDQRKFLHDLSSPLTVLHMNLENLEENLAKLPPELRKEYENFLGSAIRQTKKLEDMIRARRDILIQETK